MIGEMLLMEDLSREGRQVQSVWPRRALAEPAEPRLRSQGCRVDSEQDMKPPGDSKWMREMIKCSSLE